jgi:hypothetical protein
MLNIPYKIMMLRYQKSSEKATDFVYHRFQGLIFLNGRIPNKEYHVTKLI